MSFRLAFLLPAFLGMTACSGLPGRPGPGPEVVRPDDVLDFRVLYKESCSGCHGVEGKGGVSIALSNPVYLAIADDAVIRSVVTGGVHGAGMPAFAQSQGGILTDKQIDVLVGGIRTWARPDARRDASRPAYSASAPGDAKHGADVYTTFCSSCHGVDGQGGKGGSSIVDGAYLALVSDQYLRTVVIAGRPEFGAPDWRSDVPARPMSAQEITDVVAWLTAQRSPFPGQPYTATQERKPKEEPRQ
jgi:cytochrome c oxidase cbb3-type subunit 3